MSSTEPASPGVDLGSPLAMLAGRSPRWRTAAGIYVGATAAWKAGTAVRAHLRQRLQYTVSIDSNDPLYEVVGSWLLESLPPERRRQLKAVSHARGELVPGDSPPEAQRLRFVHDGRRSHVMMVDGHRVTVSIEQEDRPGRRGNEFTLRIDRVVFTCNSKPAADAVTKALDDLAARQEERQPRLYVAARWGGWMNRGDIPARNFDTIALPDCTAEDLIGDLGRFLDGETQYEALGLPWHRGYLFHGPPGTGKTSLAKALARHHRLDLYYVPIADLEDDGALLRLLGEMTPRSMLLLEDIDTVTAATERTDTRQGATLGGLLNALDGVATPHGMVTVMTTNRPDDLDPALLRPGRADRRIELGLLDHDQFTRLVHQLTGHHPTLPASSFTPTAPADVVEAMKRHLGDREAMAIAASLAATGSKVA